MPYLNIFLETRAAINAYKFIWNNQTACSTIVLYLGSFYFMKENFQVAQYSESYFAEIVRL